MVGLVIIIVVAVVVVVGIVVDFPQHGVGIGCFDRVGH